MDQCALDKYLQSMENGEWGDGIVLSAAVRLYGRSIVVITPDGAELRVDAAQESSTECIRLGLINTNHYVSITKSARFDENSDSVVTEICSQPQREAETLNEADSADSDDSSIQSATSQFDAECEADTSTTAAPPPRDNKISDFKFRVIAVTLSHSAMKFLICGILK